jgi:hypothetical protein
VGAGPQHTHPSRYQTSGTTSGRCIS